MYADREVTTGTNKSSVRDRLDGNPEENFKRQINGKRQRQSEDKWEHDLYDDDDDEPQVSNPKVDPRDLRSKLQKKSLQQINKSGKGSLIGGTRDLREKLSGTMQSQPVNADTPKANPVSEVVKPARKSTAVDVPAPETKKAANLAPLKKKSQKKADSVDGFLQSLGLEKYLITFQAEEVDMTALIHMTEEDLKALGIPMGPRKKILLALDSRA